MPNFAQISAQLRQLIKKNAKWAWGTEQEKAFATLKEALTKAPILACPDFNQPFSLQTDASDLGVGAALTQKVNGTEHVVAYASRSLNPNEAKFSTTEKECLAIIWALQKMRPYLEGYHFEIVTDHQALKWLNSLKNPSGRLARWALFLQQFDYEISYGRGSQNQLPDLLSRETLPDSPTTETPICGLRTPVNCSWYQNKFQEVQKYPKSYYFDISTIFMILRKSNRRIHGNCVSQSRNAPPYFLTTMMSLRPDI